MQATGNKQQQTYNLSICLRADGLSFYGCSTANAATVETEHYTCAEGERMADTLERAIAQSALLRQGTPGVVYGLASGPSMQIPLECFRKEEVHALYRLTYAQEKTGKTYYNILPHLEVAQILTVDPETEHLLRLGRRMDHPHGAPDLPHPLPGPQQHRDARAVGKGQAGEIQGQLPGRAASMRRSSSSMISRARW